jgi:hypothetical protein
MKYKVTEVFEQENLRDVRWGVGLDQFGVMKTIGSVLEIQKLNAEDAAAAEEAWAMPAGKIVIEVEK